MLDNQFVHAGRRQFVGNGRITVTNKLHKLRGFDGRDVVMSVEINAGFKCKIIDNNAVFAAAETKIITFGGLVRLQKFDSVGNFIFHAEKIMFNQQEKHLPSSFKFTIF